MKSMLLIFLLVFLQGCKDHGTAPDQRRPAIQLSVLDVGTMDVTLKITISTQAPSREVLLTRNGDTVYTFSPTTADTVVVDPPLVPELWPSSPYTYRAYLLNRQTAIDSSVLVVTTGDSSSHAIQWTVDTVGTRYSYLKDVAIIGDSVWVVGELYQRDSLGNIDPTRYNLAKWNGTSWESKRIPFIGSCSAVNYPPITAIWAFSANNILVTNGGAVVRYDGTNAVLDCGMNALLSGALNKIYARNSQEVYAVGGAGTIVKFNGTTWQRQESGTNVPLTDVWGTPDGSEVWACGFNDSNGGSVVLRHVNGTWQTLWDRLAPPRPPYIYASELGSVWSSGKGEYVAVGGRFYHHSLHNLDIVRDEWIRGENGYGIFRMRNWAYRVRGTQRNDIWLVGDDAMIWHWNGSTWHRYEEFLNPDDRLYGLAVTSNMVVAVGTRYHGIFRNGLVIIGRR